MPQTSPPPRRPHATAATAAAIVLALLFAYAWLHTAGGAPAVPAGLAAPAAPAPPAGIGQGGEAGSGQVGPAGAGERPDASEQPDGMAIDKAARDPRPQGKRRRAKRATGNADRARGGEDARAPVGDRSARARRGTAGEAGGQDPPATAPGHRKPPVTAPPGPEFAIG